MFYVPALKKTLLTILTHPSVCHCRFGWLQLFLVPTPDLKLFPLDSIWRKWGTKCTALVQNTHELQSNIEEEIRPEPSKLQNVSVFVTLHRNWILAGSLLVIGAVGARLSNTCVSCIQTPVRGQTVRVL